MSTQDIHGHYAGVVTRFTAMAIDLGIISLVALFFGAVVQSFITYFGFAFRDGLIEAIEILDLAVRALFPFFYFVFFWSIEGQTPGKAVMGIRIVRTDGHRLDIFHASLRLASYLLSIVVWGLGFVWILFNPKRKALHDIIADTVVVYWADVRLDKSFLERVGLSASISSPEDPQP